MEEYLTLIGQFGFPIFVSIYFMFRMEKQLSLQTEALHRLADVIGACPKK